jgi:hypothetical protein
MARSKNHKTTQKELKKSNKVRELAKKATEASRFKEEREEAAGNQELVIEFDTVPETQDQDEEAVADKEPVEEPC